MLALITQSSKFWIDDLDKLVVSFDLFDVFSQLMLQLSSNLEELVFESLILFLAVDVFLLNLSKGLLYQAVDS